MLSYTITGSLNLPPLIFLHGFLGGKEDWEEVIAELKEDYCCYAFDLPGHGSSPFEEHLLESLFLSFCSLKLLPCPVIGYSMGGRLALFLKEYFTEQFKGIVLLGAHPGLNEAVEKKFRWHQDLNWSSMLETQPFDAFLEAWYEQPLFVSLKKQPELYNKIIERRRKQNPLYLASILRNFSLSLQPVLKQFHPDTLFLYGEEDLKFADLYQNHLPKTVKKEEINGGHALLLENPKGVAKKIKEFL